MKIQEVTFDIDDKNLFLIDDLPLKADAIRYSILPKLEIINNELISRIVELYNIDFYSNYSVVKSPHFRLSKNARKEPTKMDYTSSAISITGQRQKNKWFGLDRGDNKVPQISPTNLSIDLDANGLYVTFYFNHPRNFTTETYKKFFDFFIQHTELIHGLANKANLNYFFCYADAFSLKEDLELKLKDREYDVIFYTTPIPYPIDYTKINNIILSNIFFFPVLNACINIALKETVNIESDIDFLRKNFRKLVEKYYPDDEIDEIPSPEISIEEIISKAETKIKVQAGIRWQVFKRDDWKCIACGRSAENDIILHIDHIIPRSKGGKDEMDNYQTLCETCNIGKSNKDDTDLRKRYL